MAFEVASLKLHPKQGRGVIAGRSFEEVAAMALRVLPGGRVESSGVTLRYLIGYAWGLDTRYQRVVGTNELLETELILSAKAANPGLTPSEAMPMVRALVEQRFQLRWRWQPREIDAWVLVPARDDRRPASGLRPFTGECSARASNPTVLPDSPEFEQKARCGTWMGMPGRERGVGLSMANIAQRLTSFMTAPVSDQTEWEGLFSFDVLATTDNMPSMAALRQTREGQRRRLTRRNCWRCFVANWASKSNEAEGRSTTFSSSASNRSSRINGLQVGRAD
jgi:uncharacterized protein (TIGR03435 family)